MAITTTFQGLCMRPGKGCFMWVNGVILSALPVLAHAAALSVAPVLLESDAPTASPSPSAITSTATKPLNLRGYAQWKSPQQTLETVGYGTASSRSSYGSGIPLKDALRLILPEGWHVYAKPGVSGAAPVTWKNKNQPWTLPLREVLRQSGLIATLNWQHMALLLRVKPAPSVPPLDTKGYAAWSNSAASGLPSNFHVGHGQQTYPASSLAGVTPVFLLNRGDLILTDLQKWASQSGWKIVWQVPEDWQVPNTTSFNGGFQKAVSQVIQALSANGANIHAVFHMANNTVVISGAGGGD